MAATEGRISKGSFIGTSSAFLSLCILSTAARCYIRFRVQREFGWDDGFLIFGICCLISGMALLFLVIDDMYEAESMVFSPGGFAPTASMDISRMIDRTVYYRKVSAAALTLMWFSICSVKFCFLAFFKNLIRQMPTIIIFWWFTLAFNIVVTSYGAAVYLISCPYFRADQIYQSVQCVQGNGLRLALDYSISQMVLDIVGDLFILVIPVVLIWKIKINWTQKLALAFTLCLTIVMVIITIARIAGLKWKGKLDSVWETYFIVLAAEVGLSLVAITAFRALYVSKAKNRHLHDTIKSFNWYKKGRSVILRIVSKTTGNNAYGGSGSTEMDDRGKAHLKHDIPRGTITGMRTFIDENGKTKHYATMDEEE